MIFITAHALRLRLYLSFPLSRGRNVSYFDLLITLLCAERVRDARRARSSTKYQSTRYLPILTASLAFYPRLLLAHMI